MVSEGGQPILMADHSECLDPSTVGLPLVAPCDLSLSLAPGGMHSLNGEFERRNSMYG